MKNRKKSKNVLSTIILVVALTVFCFAGFRLLSILHNYKSSNDEYRKIAESFTKNYDPNGNGTSESDSKRGTKTESAGEDSQSSEAAGDLIEDTDPPVNVNWTGLKAINPDIIGWIYVDGEKTINYPVLKATDNDYYLHRTFRKEPRYAGSIFIDYHNNGDFADPDTIIYGHNMRNGSMFGTLKFLYDQEKYDKNPYFWILTPNGNYRYHIFAIFKTKVNSSVYTLFSQNGSEFLEWERNLQKASGVKNTVPLTEQDKTVILSTCTTDKSERTVVIGKCVSSQKPAREE
jgi:sortase B